MTDVTKRIIDISIRPWFVVPDDLIGGHAVALVKKPVSELAPGELVAEMVHESVGHYLVHLQQAKLDRDEASFTHSDD